MTAKEAREMSLKVSKDEEKVKNQLTDIYSRITKSANKGEFLIEFKNLLSGTIQILRDNGFIVSNDGIVARELENIIHLYTIRW